MTPHTPAAAFPNLTARIARRSLAAVAVLGFLFLTDRPSTEAQFLSNRDLRQLGFAGIYRGIAEGNVTAWNEGAGFYDTRFVSRRSVERVPVRRRSVVNGPTGNNGFFLTFQTPRGNERRVRIRGFYSGFSFNPVYGEEMHGSGVKRIVLRRRGFGHPGFEMRVVDRLTERSSADGALFGRWRVNVHLDK